MKMVEFLSLSDDEKRSVLHKGDHTQVVTDPGICSQCGKVADADDFCFGCHKLVCRECFEGEPYPSQ